MISRGVAFMILATTLLAAQQAMVKILTDIPVQQLVFFRAFVSFIFCMVVMKKEGISFRGEHYPLLILRGVIGTLSLLTFFYTLHHIPLATAVTIGHLSPVFLSILAVFFLREQRPSAHWLALIISFAGVILIKGFDHRISFFELCIAVLSALLAAMAHFTVRLLKNEKPLTVLFYFSLIMMTVLFPLVLFTWKQPDLTEWICLLILGIISHYAQLFLTKALKEEEISRINGIYYLGIVLAVLFGYVFFNESFNIQTVAGMMLIIMGVMSGVLLRKTAEVK